MRIQAARGAHRRPRSRRLGRASFALVSGVTLAAAPLVAPVSALAADAPVLRGTGVVTMIHAVPGLVADVAVDGKTILTGFTASRVTDPVTLSAGKHTVTLTSDRGSNKGRTVLTATLDVVAGTTSTAVVGLTPQGSAKAFVFPEMPVSVTNGQAAVVMRDVAAAGPVKLVVDGSALPIGLLSNGSSAHVSTAGGTHRVLVESATGATVLGTQTPTLEADRVTTLYLIGSQQDHSLAWVATTRLASSVASLSTIPTGDGSTLGVPMTVRGDVPAGTAAAIAGGLGVATFALSRRRSRGRAVA